MNNQSNGFLSVSIDFDKSHLYFPRIIVSILAILLVIIIIRAVLERRCARRAGEKTEPFHFFEKDYDKLRLFGTLGLAIVYFFSMDRVGRLFPNEGFGFLFTSIPFMILLSFLFVGKGKIKAHLIPILLSSVLTPLTVWIVLGQLFHITLP